MVVLALGLAGAGPSASSRVPSPQAPGQPPPAGRTLAVTIDDLPFVDPSGRHDLGEAEAATTAILAALAAASATAVGFVNEDKLGPPGERDRRTALLRRWVEAGHLLGNHTHSHLDLNTVSAEAFLADVDRGTRVWRALVPAGSPQYFRHPMTHTGDTADKRTAVADGLARRGYTVAPHTIENADFVFNVGFARARHRGDVALAEKIAAAYLAHSDAVTAFAEHKAAEIFGRDDVPQTLLIHTNALQADALPALLARLAARGYRFVPLTEAMRDPAYRSPDTLVTRFGPSWLFRWSRSLDRPVSFAGDPEPPAWITELATTGDRAPGAAPP